MLGFYRTYTTPFEEKIPSFVDDFFLRVPVFKRFLRFFSRYIYAEFSLRNSDKVETISVQHKRILWIQWVDSSLGDSLMDLSSRVLLKGKKVDLLTKEYTADIFKDDLIFEHIFTNSSQCNPDDYDLLIIDSYRERSLKSFIGRLSHIPHVPLYGYYNVDDFNRLYFSFYRVNQLLLHPYDESFIKDTARPLLPITPLDKSIVEGFCLPSRFIAIAIGGIWKERTFHHWLDVIDNIFSKNIADKVVLVGANEAKEEASLICEKSSGKVISFVGECTFNQTAQVISRATMLICADGGLLHAANAVATPIVGLFHEVDPCARLVEANKSFGLMNKENINNINVIDIIKKAKLLLI
jgi:heptosyltransferase-2